MSKQIKAEIGERVTIPAEYFRGHNIDRLPVGTITAVNPTRDEADGAQGAAGDRKNTGVIVEWDREYAEAGIVPSREFIGDFHYRPMIDALPHIVPAD